MTTTKIIIFRPRILFALILFAMGLPQLREVAFAQDRQLVQKPAVTSDKQIALVIGNSSYPNAPLKNPVNDAMDIAQALRDFGFEVTYKVNLDQNGMKRAIRDFGTAIRGTKVALFYYAGHGLQVKNNNYLVPVDAKVESEEEVEYEAVNAGFVLAQMDAAKSDVNIVILDACRSNPFARSFRSTTNGLAQMEAPSGTLIAYATAPGSVANDGTQRNGIYTQELLKVMLVPDLSIEEVFKRVRISVRSLTGNKQTPWEASSLVTDFSFSPVAPTSGAGMGSGSGSVRPVPSASPDTPTVDYDRTFSQKEVDQKPLVTSKPKPVYTDAGRQNQVQGVVRVRLTLTAKGTVEHVTVVEGLPYGLSERAIQAALQIKFQPAIKDGRPVSVSVLIEYAFNLY